MAVPLDNRGDSRIQWLNYHHLYYFYVIAKEGTIAKAALRLRMGQPTLSTQLKQLEDSLGKELFQRSKQRLHLSEAGKVAFDYAEQIFNLGSEMVEVLDDRLQNSQVHIQIGALDSVPKQILSQILLEAYSTENCRVSVLEGQGNELFRKLHAHQIDVLVANYPPPVDSKNVFAKSLGKLDVVICGAPEFKSLKKNFPQSLEGQPLIFPTAHSKLRKDVENFLSAHRIRVEPKGETQDSSLQKLLGQEGVGLIPIARLAAEDLIKEKKLVVLGELPGVFEEIWLASAERKIGNPVAAKLMKAFHLKRPPSTNV